MNQKRAQIVNKSDQWSLQNHGNTIGRHLKLKYNKYCPLYNLKISRNLVNDDVSFPKNYLL